MSIPNIFKIRSVDLSTYLTADDLAGVYEVMSDENYSVSDSFTYEVIPWLLTKAEKSLNKHEDLVFRLTHMNKSDKVIVNACLKAAYNYAYGEGKTERHAANVALCLMSLRQMLDNVERL